MLTILNNGFILPTDFTLGQSDRLARIKELQERNIPDEIRGIPYLKATEMLLGAENVGDLPERLALPKDLIAELLLFSIVTEGNYDRYKKLYPEGAITEEEFRENIINILVKR